MERKKRSFGTIFLSFLRGLITVILILILVVSVGINILFYSDDRSPKFDFSGYHYTFFLNNCAELEHIGVGSLIKADHKSAPRENTYVLCTIGSGYKTVLCLSEKTENENGSVSYTVRGDKNGSTISYQIPESKIIGTVLTKHDMAGDVIRFARKTSGIVSLMAIPSFLLIFLSIIGIRSNKSRYEDELLESEILIEELRKIKKDEGRKSNEAGKNKNQKPAENLIPAPDKTVSNLEKYMPPEIKEPSPVQPAEENKNEPASEVSKYEFANFEDKTVMKALEIKKSLFKQITEENSNETNLTANEILNKVSDEMKIEKPSIYNEQLTPSAPVYQPQPPQQPNVQETFRQPETLRQPVHKEPVIRNYEYTEINKTPSVPDKPKPAPTVKKKAKPPVKKIEAESIDDLIKILEMEKKKLD